MEDIGGYNSEIFMNLSNREKIAYSCCICKFILNQPHRCANGHLYCLSCLKEWKKRGNKQCPACGANAVFNEDRRLQNVIDSKYVRCETSLCPWKGRLERLCHHIDELHGSESPAYSSNSSGLHPPSPEERLDYHKLKSEVDKIHSWKKDVIRKKMKKIEKKKRYELRERENAGTVPPESRSDIYTMRPSTDVVTLNSVERLPQVKWAKIDVNKNSFYDQIHDLENLKQTKRDITNKKLEELERQKKNQRSNLFKRIEDLERQREENRNISEQRILQMEKRMKENREAFHRRLIENDSRTHDKLQRRYSVIKVKMKK